MKNVAVVLDHYGVKDFFLEAGFKTFDWRRGQKEGYEIMAFTGGEDINPALYGEKPIRGTFFSERRDEIEIDAYKTAPDNVIKVGICRGAQLLNALNGGRLWQNVTGHHGGHHATDIRTGINYFVSSVHHQVMRPAKGAEIIAVARQATELASEKELLKTATPTHIEVEALWYPTTRSLCFQGHPEFGPKTCSDYFLKLLTEKIDELSAKAA
jgi:putative glutamine amidotransferase